MRVIIDQNKFQSYSDNQLMLQNHGGNIMNNRSITLPSINNNNNRLHNIKFNAIDSGEDRYNKKDQKILF